MTWSAGTADLAGRDGHGCCAATAATGYELKYPTEHGIVTNLTDMKKIGTSCFAHGSSF